MRKVNSVTKNKTGNTTNKEGKKTTQTRKNKAQLREVENHKAETLELVLKIEILKVEIHKLGQQKRSSGRKIKKEKRIT